MKHSFERYCKDYQNIENYEKALADNFKGWHCHHRLETHTSDGERRPVDITQKELKALNMYYHRPAEELIFLTTREHNAFKKGKYTGEKNPMYGKPAWNRGVPLSEEHRKKLSKPKSEEHKKKIGAASKGRNNNKHWYTDGKVNKYCYECPEGFTLGRFLHKRSLK